MAHNQVEKFGLRPYRKLDGTPLGWSPKQIYDCFKPAYATAILSR